MIDSDGLDDLIGMARSACGDMALIEEQAGIWSADERVRTRWDWVPQRSGSRSSAIVGAILVLAWCDERGWLDWKRHAAVANTANS